PKGIARFLRHRRGSGDTLCSLLGHWKRGVAAPVPEAPRFREIVECGSSYAPCSKPLRSACTNSLHSSKNARPVQEIEWKLRKKSVGFQERIEAPVDLGAFSRKSPANALFYPGFPTGAEFDHSLCTSPTCPTLFAIVRVSAMLTH